ncbi:POR [Lepeophtheirus salmonis]|uniref:NADPH--hemoprotein reductase n=1 Tax=Lepeophtheirus salmonis TaxID=72036 RepID=A0A7R8CGN3_LEPSM|nr:POR [Lepeophtheirus salmonis]CAF2777456.1 POR [Lepeophtheirus salmonis]
MHIELDIEESRIRYEAGDHVAIYPTNDSKLVESIGKALEIDLDVVFTMTPLEDDAIKKQPFPCPTTYRTALSHYVDICSFPRTHVLKEISSYANDSIEKEKLVKLSSREGKDLYQEYILDSTRNIVHILEDFPSLKIDIHHLMELLPRLQPRFYSISSSPRISPDKIHITAVVVGYQTRAGRINNGVCTTWLKPMVPKEENIYRVPIFVRRSQFRLPNRHTVPVIMIGPGTGLAPFRGFIQERSWHKSKGKPIGETHLYFGCRNKEKDYIYREELEEHLSNENAAEIWRLIGEENGHIYICGDAKNMAKEAHSIILNDVIKKQGNMSDEEAVAYLKQMESKKRYSTDVWS